MSIKVNGVKVAGIGIPGKSAYQSAKEAGYQGTEEQFSTELNSIKDKQNKITGSSGQVVGFDEGGNLIAQDFKGADNALLFGETTGEDGLWDREETSPVGTIPIRYNGYLKATRVYGVYYSDNADYAESYPCTDEVEAGDLLSLDKNGEIHKTKKKNDSKVIGIVSNHFASCIGGEGVPVALNGRVPVKVTGEISPGDYLCSSEIEGVACKADIETSPRGSIIGMALTDNKKTKDYVIAFVLRL